MIKQFYLTNWWGPNRYYLSGQRWAGSNGNKKVLHIHQGSSTSALQSDGLESWAFVVGTYPAAMGVGLKLIYIYIYIYISSSSPYRAISTDIHDLLTQPFSIVYCFQPVFKATFRIGTELLYAGSSKSSCLCLSMWRGPQEYITYEFVPSSQAVSSLSGSSNLDSFRDGW